MMEKIKFLENPDSFNENGSFIVHISNISTEKELMNELNLKFKFPYFGFNWDALYDMLRDLHWINQKKVILVHDEMPLFEYASMKTYILLLKDSVYDWKVGEDHVLEVIFPEKGKDLVKGILQS